MGSCFYTEKYLSHHQLQTLTNKKTRSKVVFSVYPSLVHFAYFQLFLLVGPFLFTFFRSSLAKNFTLQSSSII